MYIFVIYMYMYVVYVTFSPYQVPTKKGDYIKVLDVIL